MPVLVARTSAMYHVVERAEPARPRLIHERRTVDFEQLIQEITNAVLNVPLVRDLMSFVDTRWRPLWAATWIVLIALGVLKIIDSFARLRARQTYLLTNAVVARQLGETAAEQGAVEEERSEEQIAVERENAQIMVQRATAKVRSAPRVRSMVLGAAAVAIVLLGLFARGSRPAGPQSAYGRPEGTSLVPVPGPAALAPVVPAPAPLPPAPFKFIDRGWRMDGQTCVATLEMDADVPGSRRLTLFVQDGRDAVLGQDSTRVVALKRGAFVTFRLRGVRCDDVAHWQVQG